MHPLLIENFVKNALLEDLGHGRDVTTDLLIAGSKQARAVLRARAPGILAGLVPALTAFSLTDSDCGFTVNANDGDMIGPDEEIAIIEGPARAILSAERTALNIITHLAGIATLTAAYVHEVRGTEARIAATRKTLPGLRLFQKYAVEIGGGAPHRHGLDDAILIKDNHIALGGGIKKVLQAAQEQAGHMLRLAIEVDNLKQLEEVLKIGGADVILLDNMDIKTLKRAVSMAKGAVVLEASGGVDLDNVRAIAQTGVDVISVGALTHSAQALDIGLDVA
ncbi:MAG: carboxylating nicotinate-nucleotide diphosphorylase [Alphaproteobacteria bacterium]|nr:carboxylating nicotinate-nucleotide diphosphorylase [Alphaproteobacteria bacterium]